MSKVSCEYGFKHSVSEKWATENPHLVDMDNKNEILYDTRKDFFMENHSRDCKCGNCYNVDSRPFYALGENLIKAEVILSAWLSYCRESRIYRTLEFFGLR